jgi:hydroxyacylglutathione hydrolase
VELRRIETPGIAHYAYLLADGNEAAIIDPSRDVAPYLAAAREAGTRIRHVVETHRQEDFVMGSAYLARITGAQIVNGSHELFGHGDRRLTDGETFRVGSLTVRALATPGHTPESMSYAVYANPYDAAAWCVFTGDALFFGTTGRTDLPAADRSIENAAVLYDSVHDKLADLGDTALLLPAHGPGSVCGSGMARRSFSTIGDEKRYNEVFTLDRDAFARKKGGERLSRPPYFRHMERVNLKGGLDPTIQAGDVPLLDVEAIDDATKHGTLFDVREPEAFAGGHIAGSYSIWLAGLPVFGGWMADERSPVYLVGDRDDDVDAAAMHLTRIGVDNLRGWLGGGFGSWRRSGKGIESSGVLTPRELAEAREAFQVLDVREADEFADGHVPGAVHTFVGELPDRLSELGLDRDRPVVVTCSVGHRAGLGVSILLRAGYRDVRNLLGGMTAWSELDLPTE